MTAYKPSMCVTDLQPGDLVDLEDCIFASPESFPEAPFEFYEVAGTELETPDCLRVDFEGAPSIGFPINFRLYGERPEV